MMRRAAELGLPALAIADENSVAGIVRAYISRTSDFLAVAALVFAATARHRETRLSE
jgi:DNA polymerase III alpha subunit